MNDTAPQPALREWRSHMVMPVRMAIFAAVAVILTVAGPFNTGDAMRTLPRFAYWTVIIVTCYSVGYFGNQCAEAWTQGKGIVMRAGLAAVLTASGVLAVIYLINGLAIGFWPSGTALAIIAGNVVVISTVITLVFQIADHAATPDKGTPPALLDRLPYDKRGPLVALSVEDHYVRVRTTKGEDMILMRLADAIREVGDTRGLQVHRSHWIALDQVAGAARKGDGAVISLTHGNDIPVSRANVPAIKEAGLLPR